MPTAVGVITITPTLKSVLATTVLYEILATDVGGKKVTQLVFRDATGSQQGVAPDATWPDVFIFNRPAAGAGDAVWSIEAQSRFALPYSSVFHGLTIPEQVAAGTAPPGSSGGGYTGGGTGFAPIDIVATTSSLVYGQAENVTAPAPAISAMLRISSDVKAAANLYDLDDFASPLISRSNVLTPFEFENRLLYANRKATIADEVYVQVTNQVGTLNAAPQDNFTQPTSPVNLALNGRTWLNGGTEPDGSHPVWTADANYVINKQVISGFTFRVCEIHTGAPTNPALVTSGLIFPIGWDYAFIQTNFYADAGGASDFANLKVVFRPNTGNNHSSWEVVMSKTGTAFSAVLKYIDSTGAATSLQTISYTLAAGINGIQLFLTLSFTALPTVQYIFAMEENNGTLHTVTGTYTGDNVLPTYPGWYCDAVSAINSSTPIAGVLSFFETQFGVAPPTSVNVTIRALPLYYVTLP